MLSEPLTRAINAPADDLQVTILEMDVSAESNPAQIRLIVDTPAGVTIGDITRLTKALKNSDDLALALGQAEFQVEISSPGERYGLRLPWQFTRHLNQPLKVRLKSDEPDYQERVVVKGVLKQVADSGIVLSANNAERRLEWQEIENAVVITDW